jgi:hypothetical protein
MRVRSLLAAGVAALAIGAVLAPAPARADDPALVCTGTSSGTFSPGIHSGSATVTDVSSATTYSSCVGSATVTSAHTAQSFEDVSLSCDTLFATDTVVPITWSDNTTSTLTLTGEVILPQGLTEIVELTGTVTAGRYLGYNVASVGVFAATSLLGCSFLNPNGLTSLTGSSTLTITSA